MDIFAVFNSPQDISFYLGKGGDASRNQDLCQPKTPEHETLQTEKANGNFQNLVLFLM